jgi:uncharacterized protein YcnI
VTGRTGRTNHRWAARFGRRPASRLGAIALTTAALVVAVPLAAQAHVTVHPDTTTAGAESAEMTFRVPTESASASTVSVQIKLPTAHPFAQVLARPIAGWTVKVVTGALPAPVVVDGTTFTQAPVSVTWTATDRSAAIAPGQYQDFAISAGPLPDGGTVTFAAVQTYSDRSVVTWDQPQLPGQAEPEHPAPSFAITAPARAVKAMTAGPADHAARWLSGAALAVAVLALGVALVPRARSRRTTQP